MKDLYTFDVSTKSAMETYGQVRAAYDKIFADLRIPVVASEASSGDMGGDVSHEYHMLSTAGEDEVVTCGSCGYAANMEVAEQGHLPAEMRNVDTSTHGVSTGVSTDMNTVVNVWYPLDNPNSPETGVAGRINVRSVEAAVGGGARLLFDEQERLAAALARAVSLHTLRPKGNPGEDKSRSPTQQTKPRLINLVDKRLLNPEMAGGDDVWTHRTQHWPGPVRTDSDNVVEDWDVSVRTADLNGEPLDLMAIREGSPCPRCSDGRLGVQTAIELGHTFHLGTRYSAALDATVTVPDTHLLDDAGQDARADGKPSSGAGTTVPMQMGCHGIGVSRIIGAVANRDLTGPGIPWPRAIAPYEVVVVAFPRTPDGDGERLYDLLADSGSEGTLDVVLDDRTEVSGPWRLQEAARVGYPVIVTLGARWKQGHREVALQCHRLGVEENVPYDEVRRRVHQLLLQLDAQDAGLDGGGNGDF